jgi:hypothetical protein
VRQLTAESAGFYAEGTGFQSIAKVDHDNLAEQFSAHDALNAYCRAMLVVERSPAETVWHRTGGRETPERYFLARREALSITATSGNDCAAAAAMGGSQPVAANAIPTRLYPAVNQRFC